MLIRELEYPIIKAGIKITHPHRIPVIGVCPTCNENIYAGDSAWEFDDEWFCNAVHFAVNFGARKVESA